MARRRPPPSAYLTNPGAEFAKFSAGLLVNAPAPVLVAAAKASPRRELRGLIVARPHGQAADLYFWPAQLAAHHLAQHWLIALTGPLGDRRDTHIELHADQVDGAWEIVAVAAIGAEERALMALQNHPLLVEHWRDGVLHPAKQPHI